VALGVSAGAAEQRTLFEFSALTCRYRLLAPLFLGDPLRLALSESGADVHAQVRTGERVTATADFSPEP
jgi:hypothetical protein